MQGRRARQNELQRSLNRVILTVSALAALAFAVVSNAADGWSDAAAASFGVLLLVLVVGGFAAGFAVRALASRAG